MKGTKICGECKFENLSKQTQCLMCKAPLPVGGPELESPGRTRQMPRSAPAEEPQAAPSTSVNAADVDVSQVIGWVCCEPLAPIPLVPGKNIVVGRSPDCDLVLRSKAISRKHALIKALGHDIQLEDLGSANGTLLNGKRTPRAKITSGDILSIGSYEIEVRSNDALASEEHDDMEGTQVIQAISMTSGSLADGGLAEALQGLEFNEKSGTIKILSGSLRGTCVVQDGAPAWAALGADRDDEAVYRMLQLKEGRYVCTSAIESGERTMSLTVTGLLLEASRRQDMAGEDAG